MSGDVLEGYSVEPLATNSTGPKSTSQTSSKPKVNVIALIAFDSPFFGLSENVFTGIFD